MESSPPSHNRESGGLSGPSVWRQRLGNLLRFAGVGKHFIADDAQCYFMKIGLQGPIKLAELGPKNLIDEAPRRPDHVYRLSGASTVMNGERSRGQRGRSLSQPASSRSFDEG
jgi:hypothetical protein